MWQEQKVAHECVTDVLTALSVTSFVTEQTHGNMESTCFLKRKKGKEMLMISSKTQSKCENNSTYYVI